jgi:iron-sulfur cluster assembly accessory protein
MVITEAAHKKISELIIGSQNALPGYELFLRITAVLDEESNIKHQTYFDYESRDDDKVYKYDGFDLRIDSSSMQYLSGASINYIDLNDTSEFIIDNPNKK